MSLHDDVYKIVIWLNHYNDNNNGPNGHNLFYIGGDLMMRRGMLPIIMLPDGDLRIVLHLVPFWILTIWGSVHIGIKSWAKRHKIRLGADWPPITVILLVPCFVCFPSPVCFCSCCHRSLYAVSCHCFRLCPGVPFRLRETCQSSVLDWWKSGRTSEKYGRTNKISLYNHV